MTRRARSWCSFALLALMLAGCAGGADASADASKDEVEPTTTSTAPATTTTTVPPPYSFDGSVPPPPLVNTGTDYPAIYRSLSAYATWLLAHNPDSSLIGEAYVAGSPIYDRLKNDTAIASERHVRLVEEEGPLEVETISVVSSAASVRVKESVAVQRLLAEDGRVLQEHHFPKPLEWTAILQKDESGRFRIAAVDALAR
jgi:hypothetical protein